MKLSLDEALALAEEARANGHLNKFPQACIALADEILRLRSVQGDNVDNRFTEAGGDE